MDLNPKMCIITYQRYNSTGRIVERAFIKDTSLSNPYTASILCVKTYFGRAGAVRSLNKMCKKLGYPKPTPRSYDEFKQLHPDRTRCIFPDVDVYDTKDEHTFQILTGIQYFEMVYKLERTKIQ